MFALSRVGCGESEAIASDRAAVRPDRARFFLRARSPTDDFTVSPAERLTFVPIAPYLTGRRGKRDGGRSR
jgi:hypothetical protein